MYAGWFVSAAGLGFYLCNAETGVVGFIIPKNDKQIELRRYDSRARNILAGDKFAAESRTMLGALAYSPILRAPYYYYGRCIGRYISHGHDVLELGSGTGIHTKDLAQTGAWVAASDISRSALEVLAHRMSGVTTLVADMEVLPFKESSFDVVASAGSLSYGDPVLVVPEILRVLRPGGTFICVDSLNHNPIYRINRWLQFRRGKRTAGTLSHMPTLERIRSLSEAFQRVEVNYFGAVSYLMPVLACVIGQSGAARFSDAIDRLFHICRSAFKFVLVANGRR
jgi:ubiquinone/menaquinone biosynthesis C-methylase UbiE